MASDCVWCTVVISSGLSISAGDNVEVEETAATMSIAQQDALEAGESNDTPSIDQATN